MSRFAALISAGLLTACSAPPTPTTPAHTRAGNAAFITGIYHVSWAGPAQRRTKDLTDIASLGFNTVNLPMLDPEQDLIPMQGLLNHAHQLGLQVLLEDHNDAAVHALKDHPAALGWMIADDSNARIPPEELLRRHAHSKHLDPSGLTYTSLAINFANSHSTYFGRSDAVGNQSYPIGTSDPITVVYPVTVKLAAEAARTGTFPIANLQAFAWPGQRAPTPAELNNMTNQALAGGARGLLYYTYLDRTNDLRRQGALRSALKSSNALIHTLSAPLSRGVRQTIQADQHVLIHTWTTPERTYLQVINRRNTPTDIRATLPRAALLGSPNPVAGTPLTLTVKGGVISGRLRSLETQWAELPTQHQP